MDLSIATASTTVVNQLVLILERMEPVQHFRREFASLVVSVQMALSGRETNVLNQSSAKIVS